MTCTDNGSSFLPGDSCLARRICPATLTIVNGMAMNQLNRAVRREVRAQLISQSVLT
jgi:hypothetical protein